MDLDRETAERIVEVALQSRSPSVSFALQAHGGEPLLNADGIRHLVEFARATNARAAGKTLRFTVVTNLSAMTADAAEWLIAHHYTSPAKIAIAGGSNGGLLVGACMTQRPELFGVALPVVGVMDMMRFDKFTGGWAWQSDYGNSRECKVCHL